MAAINNNNTDLQSAVWFYIKLYPLPDTDLDETLRAFVVPFVYHWRSRCQRWFFLRFVDQNGPHIRLRMLVDGTTADAMYSDIFVSFAVSPVPKRWRTRTWIPASVYSETPGGGTARVSLDLYSPETSKWGTGHFLEAAESTFEASSVDVQRVAS